MNFIFRWIFYFTSVLAFLMLVNYHMHMFQLNSYKYSMEKRFIKENFMPLLGRVFGIIISIVFLNKYTLFLAILLNVLTIWGNRPDKNAKIPLKYTKRVQRMLITITIAYLIIIAITTQIKVFFFRGLLLQLCSIFSVYFVIGSNFINAPLEKNINNHYIQLAKSKIKSMNDLIVIGVTGSYGKTSVKNMIHTLLSAKYNTLMTPGNYNTTMGVVITIRQYLSPLHQVFVCEMGARDRGHIKEICDLVNPKYGVISSIGPAHLESFKSMENIVSGKFELVDALPGIEGKAFLNYDNEYIRNKKIDKNVISYGTHEDAMYRAFNITSNSMGSTFSMILPGEKDPRDFSTRLIGKHNVTNIAGAIAVAHCLDVSPEDIVMKVSEIDPIEHRLQLKRFPSYTIIDDAYNSNPSGFTSAVKTLATFDGTKIIITPGMIELGDEQYELNKQMGMLCAKNCDYIILVGQKQTKPLYDGAKEAGYDMSKLFVVNSFKDGMDKAISIKSKSHKFILFENDLPDNY